MKENWINDELLVSLLGDIIPYVRTDELANSFILPLQVISTGLHKIRNQGGHMWVEGGRNYLPSLVWTTIRERYPEVATFPLGPVVERSVKGLMGKIIRELPRDEKGDESADELMERLRAVLDGFSDSQLFYRYACFFMFEIAMLNLRGSSKNLEQDYGFLYHQSIDGRVKTLNDEAEIRAEVRRQSVQMARRVMMSLNEQGPSALKPLNPNAIVRAFYKVLNTSPRSPPEWLLKGFKHPLTVVGLKRGDDKLRGHRIASNAKIIAIHGETANVFLDYRQLMQQSDTKLYSLLHDLIEIATTVYMADIFIPRDCLLSRGLIFLIPVRHPKVWMKNADALARPLRFLSGNMVGFKFVGLNEEHSPETDFNVSQNDNRVVSLFSGGIDSFVGATHLLQEGREPWLVSHYASPILKGIQMKLVKTLRKGYPELVHVSIPVRAARKGVPSIYRLGKPQHQELIQYTRSFLFLSLAACAAIQNGIGEIRIYENGVVALNPAFSEARFNTKTTHPVFLQYFRELITNVFGVELNIHNPFAKLTKGEVLKNLDKQWWDYINETNSCWAYSRVRPWAKQKKVDDFKGLHCGRCIPCVWRQAAMQSAGMESVDDSYLLDYVPKQEHWLRRVDHTLILDLVRFCQNASRMSDENLLDLCPDFYDGDGSIEERLEMFRNFSVNEILPWFEKFQDKL